MLFERVKKVVTDWLYGPEKTITKTPVVIEKNQHHIDPKLVSFGARRTCELLQARGYKAFIVGGAVRDLLLGVKPKDFDVATDATPEQVKRCQRRAFIIGRRFRLVHVVFRDEIIECSTFRALDAQGVRKDAAGRVISDNVFGEMWEDAARRDFTINALYYDPITEKVYDYHGGFKDIQRKELRMIGEPVDRYREDPVRMMRAVRIATKLGFTMERETEKAIPKMARLLENVPAARLFDEMMKLFTCGHAEACLLKLREEGLHRALLPMLDVMFEEPGGEKFLLLALKRTDERIAIGKKISPAFLFASLLWPQVKQRWIAYQKRPGMYSAKALYAAADDVLATQCQQLAIQNRFQADMKLIWMLQLRFERCTGKNPYSLVRHPKYRAGYDFMLLRSLVGDVPPERVRWWELFVDAAPEERAAMISEQEMLARRTGDQAREGQRRKQADEDQLLAEVEEIAANGGRKPRPWEARRNAAPVAAARDDSRFSDRDERPEEALDDDEDEEEGGEAPVTERAAGEGLSRSARRRRRRRERMAAQKAAEQQGDVAVKAAAPEKKAAAAEAVKPVAPQAKAPVQKAPTAVVEKKPEAVPAAKKTAPVKVQPQKTAKPSAPVQLTKVERTIVSASGEKLVQIETAAPSAVKPQVPASTPKTVNAKPAAAPTLKPAAEKPAAAVKPAASVAPKVDKKAAEKKPEQVKPAAEAAAKPVAPAEKPEVKAVAAAPKAEQKPLLAKPPVKPELAKPVEKPALAKPEEKLSLAKPQPKGPQPAAEKSAAAPLQAQAAPAAAKSVEPAGEKPKAAAKEPEEKPAEKPAEKAPAKPRKAPVRKKAAPKKSAAAKVSSEKDAALDELPADTLLTAETPVTTSKKKTAAKKPAAKKTTVKKTAAKKPAVKKTAAAKETAPVAPDADALPAGSLLMTPQEPEAAPKPRTRKAKAVKSEKSAAAKKPAARRATAAKAKTEESAAGELLQGEEAPKPVRKPRKPRAKKSKSDEPAAKKTEQLDLLFSE